MIKQAIIPLAGLGTRLLPLTSVFPKELLPINGKPGIEYILDECIEAGIKEESAYYESLHELPLIANLVSRKKLYEMNNIISDTAEYGCYLFNNDAIPLLSKFFDKVKTDIIGSDSISKSTNSVDNKKLIEINETIRYHSIEIIGDELRQYMTSMKSV